MITEQKLQEMEARANAATPGPWVQRDIGKHEWEIVVCGTECDESKLPEWGQMLDWLAGKIELSKEPRPFHEINPFYSFNVLRTHRPSDAEFCAAARDDIPRLVAACREQAAKIDRLKEEQTHYDARIRGAQQVVDYFRTENERIRKDITEFLDVFEQEPEEASITPLLLFARQGGQA